MRWPKPGSVVSLLAIVILAVTSSVYLLFGVARVDWFKERITASMVIPDSANLVPRSPILLSGIRSGEVTSTQNTPDGVEVRFWITSQARIPTGSQVVIESLSALSEPYINFRPTSGDGPYITDGQRISTQSVRIPSSLPDVATQVVDLLNQLDPDAISSLIDTFSQSMAGTEKVLPQLTRASDLLAATLLARTPQIRALLINAQVPGPDVAVAGAQMAEAGPLWGQFGVKVSEVVASLEVLLNARPVPEAYTEGNGLVAFLPRVTDYINRIGPDLQRLYPVVSPLIINAGNSLQNVDISALIAQAVDSVSPDGAIRLQITLN